MGSPSKMFNKAMSYLRKAPDNKEKAKKGDWWAWGEGEWAGP